MDNLNLEFLNRMSIELEANAHKGDWNKWKPQPEDIIKEMDHHLNKLKLAFYVQDLERIKEFSADLANFCEKSFDYAENKQN